MRRLIITADDLGRSQAMDLGIARAAGEQLVTAVSVMVTGPHVEKGLELLDKAAAPTLGLHLSFTQTTPVSEPRSIPSLIAKSSRFAPSVFSLARKRIQKDELEREAEAQLERYVQLTGSLPLFVNTHQHAQVLPSVLDTMLALCQRHGITRARWSCDLWPIPNMRLRSALWPVVSTLSVLQRPKYIRAGVRHTQGILGGPASEHLSTDRLCRLLSRVPNGLTELVVHPAEGSQDVLALASSRVARIIEAHAIQRLGFDVL